MSVKQSVIVLILLPLLLVGCTQQEMDAQVEVEPPISIQISTSLTHWLPKINTCAETLNGSGIVVNVIPYPSMDFTDANLTIYPGFKGEQEANIGLLAMDKIAVILNADYPVSGINVSNIADIFSGKFSNWNQLLDLTSAVTNSDLPINVFTYGASSDLTLAFQKLFLNEQPIGEEAVYVPSWEVMLEKVDNTPGSIGFVLESQLSAPLASSYDFLKTAIPEPADLPIIALFNVEPEGNLRLFLLCLQTAE